MGSEMCIRDSVRTLARRDASKGRKSFGLGGSSGAKAEAGVAQEARAEAEARAGAATRAATRAGARGEAVTGAKAALPVPALFTCLDEGRHEGAKRPVFTTVQNLIS